MFKEIIKAQQAPTTIEKLPEKADLLISEMEDFINDPNEWHYYRRFA